MTATPARSYTRLAAAIVIAAVMIAAAILATSAGRTTQTTLSPNPGGSSIVTTVQLTGTESINSSNGRPVSVNTHLPVVSNDGLNLTAYITSRTVTIGQWEGITAGVQDDTNVPLTVNESNFLSITITVKDSSGYQVFQGGPCPSPVLAQGTDGTNPPPQGFQCSVIWDTSSLVNGFPLQPGTYQITIMGAAGGPDNTIESVSTVVDVTLT